MLSKTNRPQGFDTHEKELWEDYRLRMKLPETGPRTEFFRQVVYDHFATFNNNFPAFDLERVEFCLIELSVDKARTQIRYFNNEPVEFWSEHFDDLVSRSIPGDYMIFREMMAKRTPPFPPILMDGAILVDVPGSIYGRPFHLVEGTHRTSYLLRMTDLGLIEPHSLHDFVLIRQRRI